MRQDIIDLYDEYTHKPLPRRVFLDRLSKLAGGTAAAAAILPLIETSGAKAAMVAPDDDRLETKDETFGGSAGMVKGYMARPKGAGKLPSVLVIHENRGLNEHIKDVTRRVALEGFNAYGVDFLSPMGGTPGDEDVARGMFQKLDMGVTVGNGISAVEHLRTHDMSTGKVGTVGFCWGGGLVNQLAVHSPNVAASVAYYGRQADGADAAKISGKLMLHYGGLDQRINAGIEAYEKALKAAGVDYQIFIYEGANHAFNNDTAGPRYDPDAAKLAWGRTIEFFKTNLG